MDNRDQPTWVVLELSRFGEDLAQQEKLEDALREGLCVGEDYPIFIPISFYLSRGKRRSVVLMDGYAFVASGLPDTTYFALEQKPFVNQVMSATGGKHKMRTLATVPDSVVEGVRARMRDVVSQDLSLGESVVVLEGVYKNMEGTIRALTPEGAFVQFQLRSLDVMTQIPRVLLEVQDKVAE